MTLDHWVSHIDQSNPNSSKARSTQISSSCRRTFLELELVEAESIGVQKLFDHFSTGQRLALIISSHPVASTKSIIVIPRCLELLFSNNSFSRGLMERATVRISGIP